MQYSLVIPTLNHLNECLKPCIKSIQKYTDLKDIEILVVANGCNDGTEEYVKSLDKPFKLLQFDKPIGCVRAYNEGIKASSGKYVIVSNDDIVLLPQKKNTWLEILTKPFEKDPQVAITGPMKSHDDFADKDYIVTFFAMFRKDIVEGLGLLDEVFNPGFGEDVDIAAKAQQVGYKIAQVPQKEIEFSDKISNTRTGGFPIYHEGHITFLELDNRSEILARNNAILAKRYQNSEKK